MKTKNWWWSKRHFLNLIVCVVGIAVIMTFSTPEARLNRMYTLCAICCFIAFVDILQILMTNKPKKRRKS